MDNIDKVGHSEEEIVLAILLRDEKENLIAGISGFLWGHCLEIDYLWVDQIHRGQGIGTRLVNSLEKAAAGRECTMVTTNTFSFRAPKFYKNLGYDVFGVIFGYGRRYQRVFLSKNL